MPRNQRPHAPRAGFHITARTQGGVRWFDEEMRSRIVVDIENAALSFGHSLLAHVVMPNHFHLVVRQGDTPLGWMMQRIMQRAAYFVRVKHAHEGHVFGRRYWLSACANAAYLRRAIVYSHLNPCAAKLSASPEAYEWSSHNHYLKATLTEVGSAGYIDGRLLFANCANAAAELINDYQRFVDFTVERRRSGVPGDWLLPEGVTRLLLPLAAAGDAHWVENYTVGGSDGYQRPRLPDIADRAKTIIHRLDPDYDIDSLRHAGRLKAIAPLRRNVIVALRSSGYRPGAIARCLRVSPALVSRVGSSIRVSAARQQ